MVNTQSSVIGRVERATRYVAKLPSAIDGNEGHNALFRVTCVLVEKFKLSPEEAWKILLEYNLRCEPPWCKDELIHKLSDDYEKVGISHPEGELRLILHFPPGYKAPANAVSDCIVATSIVHDKPNTSGFGPGIMSQLHRLAAIRGIPLRGLIWATIRKVLVFGNWFGQEVFGVTDQRGTVLELRRLDGAMFPAYGCLSERKSHAVKGSNKRWPLGILEAKNYPCIALVEGVPDFLAAHELILREQTTSQDQPVLRCAPVAMLSANVSIDEAALLFFNRKHVRIFYHNDASGVGWKAARQWQQQIIKAGAWSCEFFHFKKIENVVVKDLNDYLIAVDKGVISGELKLFPNVSL